jgi:hypothetical protein
MIDSGGIQTEVLCSLLETTFGVEGNRCVLLSHVYLIGILYDLDGENEIHVRMNEKVVTGAASATLSRKILLLTNKKYLCTRV